MDMYVCMYAFMYVCMYVCSRCVVPACLRPCAVRASCVPHSSPSQVRGDRVAYESELAKARKRIVELEELTARQQQWIAELEQSAAQCPAALKAQPAAPIFEAEKRHRQACPRRRALPSAVVVVCSVSSVCCRRRRRLLSKW